MNTDYNLPFTNKTEDQIVFQNPWHSQLFAITVQMSEKGNFSWKEFVEVFGESLKKQRTLSYNLDGNNDYFSCWLNALEEILIIKKVSNKVLMCEPSTSASVIITIFSYLRFSILKSLEPVPKALIKVTISLDDIIFDKAFVS